jgi:hypothetical protein
MSILPPFATLVSTGSGYANNVSVSIPTGSLRSNITTGRFEVWSGNSWAEVVNDKIKDHIQSAMTNVTTKVTELAKNNVTIQDALIEWLEASERFKIIATLAEQNK